MNKIIVSKVEKGIKTIISEKEVSDEQMSKIREKFSKMQSDKKERIQEIHDKIPEIHWEILKYANTHNKNEVLEKYPDNEDFINKIIFNNE